MQPAAGGSSRAGRSFSQFFGLNDLVTGNQPSFFATGVSAADLHGLSGGPVDFVVRGPKGEVATTFSYTPVAGETFGNLVSELNNTSTGLGTYMTFALDGAGHLTATPTSAFALDEKPTDPVAMYLQDIYTVTVNLAGLPGISIPAGFDHKGLPLGLQLIGPKLSEQKLLNSKNEPVWCGFHQCPRD